MVAAFDYCLHGKGGAAPSIDTAMHGLVDAAHVDHLHPDSGIAIATAADGEAADQGDLRRQGRVGAVAPARLPARPRHRRDQGAEPAGGRLHPRRPRHHRVGRHLRRVRGELAVDHPTPPRRTSRRTRKDEPVRCPREEVGAAQRRQAPGARPRSSAPTLRGIASQDRPMVGHFTDDEVVLDFLASRNHPRLAELGTSCPDHFLRTKVKPMVARPPGRRAAGEVNRPPRRAARGLPRRLRTATTTATRRQDSPGDPRRRPADRAGARASACSATARTSRPPASPASSTSTRST